MKLIVISTLAALFASACGKRANAPPPPSLQQEPAPVPFKSLGWSGERFTLDDKPFTGTTVDYYKGGALKARYQLREGVYHGLVEEWYENGNPKTRTEYQDGKHEGKNVYWNPDGTVQSTKIWKDDVKISEEPGGP